MAKQAASTGMIHQETKKYYAVSKNLISSQITRLIWIALSYVPNIQCSLKEISINCLDHFQ